MGVLGTAVVVVVVAAAATGFLNTPGDVAWNEIPPPCLSFQLAFGVLLLPLALVGVVGENGRPPNPLLPFRPIVGRNDCLGVVNDDDDGLPNDGGDAILLLLLLLLVFKFFFQLGVVVVVVLTMVDRPFVPGETNGGGASLLLLLILAVLIPGEGDGDKKTTTIAASTCIEITS